MQTLPPLATFQVGQPLFGNPWLALLAVLGFIALLLAAVAALGRVLAATHPAAPARTPSTPPSAAPATAASTAVDSNPQIVGEVPSEIIPVLLSAITACLGSRARVASIQRVASPLTPTPSIEALMQQWSYEGRRQIYSSHKVR
jgi:hypothetical protein